MSNSVFLRFSSDKSRGSVEVESLHPAKFYSTHGYHHEGAVGCGKTVSEKDARYIKWMDHTGLVRANSRYHIGTLHHKRSEQDYSWPRCFDHTTRWRKKGDRWPLFVLTEPYHLPNEVNRMIWDEICDERGLKYKIYEPSDKSLWVTNSTYMIFWWCPEFFSLNDIPELMTHPDFESLRNELKYTERFYKVKKETK